jgi:hypothetical protein
MSITKLAKRFKFPKGITTLHSPFMSDLEFSKQISLNQIEAEIKRHREKLGYSKSSGAKYLLEVDVNGEIWTEIYFVKY